MKVLVAYLIMAFIIVGLAFGAAYIKVSNDEKAQKKCLASGGLYIDNASTEAYCYIK